MKFDIVNKTFIKDDPEQSGYIIDEPSLERIDKLIKHVYKTAFENYTLEVELSFDELSEVFGFDFDFDPDIGLLIFSNLSINAGKPDVSAVYLPLFSRCYADIETETVFIKVNQELINDGYAADIAKS